MTSELLSLRVGFAILGGGIGATVAEASAVGPLAMAVAVVSTAVGFASVGSRIVLRVARCPG